MEIERELSLCSFAHYLTTQSKEDIIKIAVKQRSILLEAHTALQDLKKTIDSLKEA